MTSCLFYAFRAITLPGEINHFFIAGFARTYDPHLVHLWQDVNLRAAACTDACVNREPCSVSISLKAGNFRIERSFRSADRTREVGCSLIHDVIDIEFKSAACYICDLFFCQFLYLFHAFLFYNLFNFRKFCCMYRMYDVLLFSGVFQHTQCLT